MASPFTAVFDACVLYPFSIRDLLIQLASTGMFRGRWTEAINEEWIRALVAKRGAAIEARARTVGAKMAAAVPDSIITGYEALIDGLKLPDPKDRHVLAAAIVGHADVIVTRNLRHFPDAAIGQYGIEAQDPDEFVAHLIDLDLEVVCQSVKTIRARLKKPAFTPKQYLDRLRANGLTRTADLLAQHADKI